MSCDMGHKTVSNPPSTATQSERLPTKANFTTLFYWGCLPDHHFLSKASSPHTAISFTTRFMA